MTVRGARCSLTRAIAFHATHAYRNTGPSHRHGHLYRVEVTVRSSDGSSLPVADLDTLDAVLTREVTEPLAGSHLNDVLSDADSVETEPTCEAFAAWCWRRIAARLPATVALERVRVAEDATLWADCTGVE